jgi:catechol 2,3-dioxygenase-like lactoylglutathione lyase family enzyme
MGFTDCSGLRGARKAERDLPAGLRARRGSALVKGGKRHPRPRFQRSAREIGLARVCIRVDSLEEHLTRLDQHSVRTLSAPKELTLGVTKVRVVCFRDPDDVLLEYIEFADKPWGT